MPRMSQRLPKNLYTCFFLNSILLPLSSSPFLFSSSRIKHNRDTLSYYSYVTSHTYLLLEHEMEFFSTLLHDPFHVLLRLRVKFSSTFIFHLPARSLDLSISSMLTSRSLKAERKIHSLSFASVVLTNFHYSFGVSTRKYANSINQQSGQLRAVMTPAEP